MKKIHFLLIALLLSSHSYSQVSKQDSAVNALKIKRDSTLRATMHADSAKINKEYDMKLMESEMKTKAVYPLLQAGENSGVIPVKDPTEIPDPSIDYKLLFELIESNPDSTLKDINFGLAEVARIINLHVAAGIPPKKIFPVVVVHGPGLMALTNNDYYKEHCKTDNPNLDIINKLAALGTRFIACGQAMAFLDIKKEVLLPIVKVSVSSQTVLTSYQLKGYVKKTIMSH